MVTYWKGSDDLIPSAALVELLGDFRLTPGNSRTALSRLALKGRLIRTRVGRRTFYKHTPSGAKRIQEVRSQVESFGTAPRDWDGRWWIVAFNVPEADRARRHVLRAQLRERRFGSLYDGVWISPYGSEKALHQMAAGIGVRRVTVMEVCAHSSFDVGSVFGLDEVARGYAGYIQDFSPFVLGSASVGVTAGQALILRTVAWDRWRRMVLVDPDLPDALLPRGWPRSEARRLFTSLQTGLQPLARERVQDAVACS